MYTSAIKSGIQDNITFIKNGVDNIRRMATMYRDDTFNNGGSYVAINEFQGMFSGNVINSNDSELWVIAIITNFLNI